MSRTTIDKAREIMGEQNSLDPGEVEGITGHPYTKHQLGAVKDVPFSEKTLEEWAQKSSVLLPGQLLPFPKILSIFGYSGEQEWVQNPPFSGISPRWYLIRRGALPNSHGSTWKEQQELLKKHDGYVVPPVSAVFFAHRLFGRAGGGKVVTTAVRCHGGRFAIMPTLDDIGIYEQQLHNLRQALGVAVEAQPIGTSIWL